MPMHDKLMCASSWMAVGKCLGNKGSYGSSAYMHIGVCIQGLLMCWGLLSDVTKDLQHL